MRDGHASSSTPTPGVLSRRWVNASSTPATSTPRQHVLAATARDLELGVGAGLSRWLVVEWPPRMDTAYHHPDTVDFDTVLVGSIVLILGDGEHELHVGDCVLIPGVDHAWRVGPDGCTTSVLLLGSARPS